MTNSTTDLSYRRDIAGLRAIAVIPVCTYHVGLPIFPGGFVGVDIFFVISGYLMALLISRAVANGTFSLVGFYERRIRRIFPALLAMLAVVAAAAALLMTPRLLVDVGYTLVATTIFASNVAFARRSANYFDAPTELNPLLHTWSLSVEEQYYVIFPIFMLVAWRMSRVLAIAALTLAAALSLAASIWGTANAPTATFYLLPTRAWELLLGALVALCGAAPNDRVATFRRWSTIASAMGWIGLVLILVSLVGFHSEMRFPGAAALLPCIGAALLLQAGRDAQGPVSRLLSQAPLEFFGKISYSLYLWHWPLIVFGKRFGAFSDQHHGGRLLLLILACGAAYASWRWIEEPFRVRGRGTSQRVTFAAAAAISLGLASTGWVAQSKGGWPDRFPGFAEVAITKQLAGDASNETWAQFPFNKCFVGEFSVWAGSACFVSSRTDQKVLLWGDSFLASYAYGFVVDKSPTFDVMLFASGACPPLIGYHAASHPACSEFNRQIGGVIQRYGISTVVMGANWVSYLKRGKMRLEDIKATIDHLRTLGVRVVLAGQSPVFPFSYPDEYFFEAYGAPAPNGSFTAPLDADARLNERMAALSGADAFFDAMKPWCEKGRCTFKLGADYLVADHGHFSGAGSILMARHLSELLKR